MSIFEKISHLFKPTLNSNKEFRDKYQYFQNLLSANDEALGRMTHLSELLQQREPFSFGRGQTLVSGILINTYRMIENFQKMCGNRYNELWNRYEEVSAQKDKILSPKNPAFTNFRKKELYPNNELPYSLDLHDINLQYIWQVGGKMARLGEMRNNLGVPVPDGVCITSRCFEEFLAQNNLREKINDLSGSLDINNAVELREVSRAIQAMLVSAPIPEHIEKEVLKAYDRLSDRLEGDCLLAVRSSAVGEDDPRHSFAGLHYTALNVSRNNLVDACWEVLISKYLPQSMVYRFITGLRDIDMPMNVGCMKMVNSAVSGILFTVDPQKIRSGMIIQVVRGIGSLVVEGKVTPQEYVVERNLGAKVLEFNVGSQEFYLKPRQGDGLNQEELDLKHRQEQLLTSEQIKKLVEFGLTIEAHFGIPQDIEWTIAEDGSVYILQTRPLQVVSLDTMQSAKVFSLPNLKEKYPVLLEGGNCASQGIGAGPVFIATQDRFLVDFPYGGVLVAKKTSPAYTRVLHKAAAVITEVGNTTGHLSVIARELSVPIIVNMKGATSKLENGQEVTIDAYHGAVFNGHVEEIADSSKDKADKNNPFHDTPIYRVINQMAEHILPLHLTDPQSDSFKPENCKTIHDITRFCHEMSIQEMFNINDAEQQKVGRVRKLDISIPLEIYVIDLGEGLMEPSVDGQSVKPVDIISEPFKNLIEGMNTPGIPWSGPVPIDLRGFAGLIMNTMVDTGRPTRELGSRSYVMVSRHYVNFSARMGYHFSSLDAYAGSSIHRNYISYRFKGGAADSKRRERRAKFIAYILNNYGFEVIQRRDHVHATVRKIEKDKILYLLRELGRLIGAVRNADVTMINEDQVKMYAQAFLSGSSSPVESMQMKNKKE